MSDIDIVTWLLSIRHNDRSVELHCQEAAAEIERLRVIVQGWELSERDSTALLAMLSKPDHPNAALRQAAKRHKQITSEGDMLSADGSASRRTPMIEPTEGEIVDVLNNYLNSGSRDTFHQILIGRAIAEIKHLRMRVAELKNGFEGSCTACEPVAEMNKKLVQERDEARWEVCGFHHLTGFLAGDYANSRGWNYFNDERKWPKFPQSVADFQEFLRGQDKIFLESNDRLRKENEQLRKERDEARREVCRGEAMLRLQRNRVHRESEEVVRMAKEIAVERGWDCFKENS